MRVGNSVCGMRSVAGYPSTNYGHSAVFILWCTLYLIPHTVFPAQITKNVLVRCLRTPWLSVHQIYEDSIFLFLSFNKFLSKSKVFFNILEITGKISTLNKKTKNWTELCYWSLFSEYNYFWKYLLFYKIYA